MSFSITEVAEKNIIELEITGKLTKEAYEEFVPMTEAVIEKYGKARLLFSMHDFHGWDAGAMWEDTKFGVRHFTDLDRIALVGETKWEHGMAVFCKAFTMAKVRYFDRADIDKAREWIHEEA